MVGVSDPVVKKDLYAFGTPGKTGVGYAVDPLLAGITRFLGWDNPARAVLVGVGGIGAALLGSEDIRVRYIEIVAAFDVRPEAIGVNISGVNVYDAERLIEITRNLGAEVGVITVPEHAAQTTANRLAVAGVSRIWSFSAASLEVTRDVTVKREILSSGLAELLAVSAPAGAARINGIKQRYGA
jgi:redox-sensing transcriptional repressor